MKCFSVLPIPVVAQHCGSLTSSNVVSHKLFYFRVFSALWSYAALGHNFSRFVRYGSIQYWFIFLSQWTAIAIASYFTVISGLHLYLLRYVHQNKVDVASGFCPDANPRGLAEIEVVTHRICWRLPFFAVHYIRPVDAVFERSWCLRFFANICESLFSFALTPSVCITLGYWTLMVEWSTYFQDSDDIEKFLSDIQIHGVLMVLVLVDYASSLSYVEYRNCVYPMFMATAFSLWSIVHFETEYGNFNGQRYIYPLLDWNHPVVARVFVLSLVIAFMGVYCLLAFVKNECILKRWAKKKRFGRVELEAIAVPAEQPVQQELYTSNGDESKDDKAGEREIR